MDRRGLIGDPLLLGRCDRSQVWISDAGRRRSGVRGDSMNHANRPVRDRASHAARSRGAGPWGSGLLGHRPRARRGVRRRRSGRSRLIVRSQRPLNLETPVAVLDHRLTPNDVFFVRSHFGAPAVDLMPWEVELVGLVDRPLRLTLDDAGPAEQATKAAVLQCAGNGRGLYRPRVPGVPWERGARRAGGMVGRSPGRPAGSGRAPGRARPTCISSAAMRRRRPGRRRSCAASPSIGLATR